MPITLPISTVTLCFGTAYVLVWLLTMLYSKNHAKLGKAVKKSANQPLAQHIEPVSVVIIHDGSAESLRRGLPAFLAQNHPDYEVVLVNTHPLETKAEAYLDLLTPSHPNLHTFTLPTKAQNISPETLAITLGMRSAQHPWVVLTQLCCRPATSRWLSHLACEAQPGTMFVAGITLMDTGGGLTGIEARFTTLWQQMITMPRAMRHGLYTEARTNLMIHCPTFMESGGLSAGGALREGMISVAVNQLSRKGNTRICFHPEAVMHTPPPANRKEWLTDRLFLREASQLFTRRWRYAMHQRAHHWLVWMHTLLLIATVIASATEGGAARWIGGTALLMATVHSFWRINCFKTTTKALAINAYTASLGVLLHCLLLWNWRIRLAYNISDKNQYKKNIWNQSPSLPSSSTT